MSHLLSARRVTAPLALAAALALPALAGAAGTQTIDKTAPLKCGEPLGGRPASIRIFGTLPASVRQGEFINLTGLSTTVRFQDPIASTGPLGQYRLGAYAFTEVKAYGGETDQSALFQSGLSTLPTTRREVSPGEWEFTEPADGAKRFFVGGTAAVRLEAGRVGFDYNMVPAVNAPGVFEHGGNDVNCIVDTGALRLATIANEGAAAAGPPALFVSSATPNEGISSARGGLLVLRGTNLKGVRTVKIGTRALRAMFVTQSSVYVNVPPMPDDDYPVSVSTATGVTSATNADVFVHIYGG